MYKLVRSSDVSYCNLATRTQFLVRLANFDLDFASYSPVFDLSSPPPTDFFKNLTFTIDSKPGKHLEIGCLAHTWARDLKHGTHVHNSTSGVSIATFLEHFFQNINLNSKYNHICTGAFILFVRVYRIPQCVYFRTLVTQRATFLLKLCLNLKLDKFKKQFLTCAMGQIYKSLMSVSQSVI